MSSADSTMESVAFIPHGDTCERSGRFIRDEGLGLLIEGWEDGRNYLVGDKDVRPETEDERYRREVLGYYIEDGAR